MAKEQLAVIEMVTNMILGKTGGISKVDFVPQKIRCPEPQSIVYENPGQTLPKKHSGKPGDSFGAFEESCGGTGILTRHRYAPLYGIASWKCHL